MSRGRFIAIYTSRMAEGGFGQGDGSNWNSAFVRSIGEPAVFDPTAAAQRPGLRHPTGEYARYEPEYDEQFRRMVDYCSEPKGQWSVAVPASVDDVEALRLLGEMYSAMPQLHVRFYDQPHEKRNKSERRLRDVIGLISLRQEWALFLHFFDRYTPCVIFLSDNGSDVEAVAEAVVTDGNHENVIEKW